MCANIIHSAILVQHEISLQISLTRQRRINSKNVI